LTKSATKDTKNIKPVAPVKTPARAPKRRPIIAVENVTRRFQVGKDREVEALRGVDLEIYKGDFLVIFGPSGCGKSTLMNIMTGIDKPTSGKVWLGRYDFSGLGDEHRGTVRARNYGIVYQMAWWVRSLNVLENVALPLYIRGKSRDEARETAMEKLKELHVDHLGNQLPTQLSGGEQQQVEIARALVVDPAIIVADEPTGNLDSFAADKLMGYFDFLNREYGKTVILITHNSAYWTIGTRRAEMRDGKIIKVTEQQNHLGQRT